MRWQCWSGAGNSFLISDEWSESWDVWQYNRPLFVKKLCSSFPHAKVDGLIYLKKNVGYDFEWEFYNSDGSLAEMCGNAARCVSGYYQKNISMQQTKIRFLSLAGDIETEFIGPSLVKVLMPKVQIIENDPGKIFFVNVGVPHVVLESSPTAEVAQQWRYYGGKSGANVTFVELQVGTSTCKAVTFERGVEGFTRACGTGAVACAVYLSQQVEKNSYEIQMPGGTLFVEKAKDGFRPILIGEMRYHYDLEINLKETM